MPRPPALEPYAEARAEELVRRSAQLEAAAADAARSGDPDVRELANLQLSALAALDLAAADDLLTGAAQEGQAMLESEASTWAQAHAELSPLLELSPMLGYSQLLAERPEEGLLDEDVATARAELLERAGTAIDEIIAQAAGGTAKAVEGLGGLGDRRPSPRPACAPGTQAGPLGGQAGDQGGLQAAADPRPSAREGGAQAGRWLARPAQAHRRPRYGAEVAL